MAAIQTQIQALLAGGAGGEAQRGGEEVVKPQIFDGSSAKVEEFTSACKLYIRMRMREELVEGQVQWILSYVQGGLVDV